MDKHKNKLTASEQQLKAASHQLAASQRQLKASRQQFQSLVETSSDWIWQIDLEGKHTYSNHVIERKLGYPADVFIEMDTTELVHPEDRQVFGEIYKKAIRTKTGWDNVVLRWRGKDGKYRYFESSARPKLGPDGELIGFIGVDRDITERKQAEEKLRTKERVFDTSLSAISIADPEGIINEANTAFLQVWGFSNKDEVLGRKISCFLQSEEKATEIVEILNKAGVWKGDFIAKKKDGSTFIAHSFATVLHDNNGEIVGYQSSVRDITERKKIEEKLKDSEKRSRTLLAHSPVCTKIVDLDFNLQFMSESGIKDLKIDDITEFYGKPYPFDFYPESFKNTMAKNLEKVRETGKIIEQEGSVLDIDGNDLWFHSTLVPVNDEQGQIDYIMVVSMDTTDRKQAEEEIERIFNMTNYMVCVASLDGYFTRVNASFEHILGYSPEELLSKPFFDFIHPDDVAKTIAVVEEKLSSGVKVIAFENRYRCKDGSYKWLSWTSQPVPEENCTYAIAYDVTERKQAEDELKATNQQLITSEQQLMASNQQLAASEKQLRKATHEMRERIKELNCIYGLARLDEKSDASIEQIIDELVELIPQGWQYPEIAAARITLGKYKTKTKNFRKTKWCQTADIKLYGKKAGSIEVCYLKEKPLADEGPFLAQERNLINGLASRLGRIAERKRAERILRRSEANLAQSQVMANLGSWGWNLKNDRVWWSDQMYRIFGLEPGKPKQPTFKTFLSRVHPDDREMLQSTLAGIRKNKETSGFEFRTVSINGQVRTLYSHCGVEYDNENNPVRMFGTNIDITERKHTEQERERLYRAVAAKNQELQSIVFIASHDLRSPLVNVKGFAGELERTCEELTKVLEHKAITEPLKEKIEPLLKEDIPESLSFIKAGADKMELLISGLLRLSRIGTAALEVDKLNMGRMVKDILKTVRFDIQKRNAKVDVGNMPHCFGDASQVNQVFSNLIDNALKYMHPKREAIIQISGRSKDGHSIYCVQDNGIGISVEHMDKVFEIFHRLNPNETDGEGLGLTIVKRILDRQDGRIWVESERGKGSRFYVSLPAG
jgi:PAS domain S-box-containing protein